MDIISKLQLYRENKKGQSKVDTVSGQDIPSSLGGKVCSNIQGSCVLIENKYPLSYIHGGYRLGDVLNTNHSALNKLNPDVGDIGIDNFLFIDTETTGLGGAGTVAFLVGVGFFSGDWFILRQFFMRDYDDEPAVLEHLNALFERFCGLVSFNGKCFDWNLIESRYIFNRMQLALIDPIHLDLLYPARRLWGKKLDSCRLISLEENILGEYRINDIPGELIPSTYFKFLEYGDTGEIKRVLEHNRLDILSMVSLLRRILLIVGNPMDEAVDSAELLGVARIFELCGEDEMVIKCYERCMKSDKGFIGGAAAKNLGKLYKRAKNYERAIECWEYILSSKSSSRIAPLIELAKYYEHKERNYNKALSLAQKAMDICLEMGHKNNSYFYDIKKRVLRLKTKMQKAQNA